MRNRREIHVKTLLIPRFLQGFLNALLGQMPRARVVPGGRDRTSTETNSQGQGSRYQKAVKAMWNRRENPVNSGICSPVVPQPAATK